jgi:hypothetical protein
MSFSQSDSADSQNPACDLANYVLVDRVKLAEAKSIIWELAEKLVALERASYNLEACDRYWEANLTNEQILERVEYFYGKFWDELPSGSLGILHHQVVDLGRVLETLAGFALSVEGDK